ncbi:MAG: hypothetical protein ACOXZ4_00875 [Sphaerochaetaceae bacterium]|jgi:hypothetical protein
MMDKKKLRGADLVTSVLFFVLGAYILYESFHMPLKDSYAGVQSVWYVSPALMPLIIGLAIILLSIVIFFHGLKNGGVEALKEAVAALKGKKLLSDANIRYASVLIPLIALVYMNLTRVDFFLALVLYLCFTITVFYVDEPHFIRSTFYFHMVELLILFILALFNLDKLLNQLFIYTVDIIVLLMIAALMIWMKVKLRGSTVEDVKKKYNHAMLMSFLAPLVLVPVFRYMLRVPLPKEGGIVNLMSLIYYTLR